MIDYLEFEKPVAALARSAEELRATDTPEAAAEAARLDTRAAKMIADLYAKLTPWQRTQVARHPQRPRFSAYRNAIADDWMPLSGDRAFADDPAIVGGFASIGGRRVVLIGHEKGHDTTSRLTHNFGMGRPEGYRKAIRLMELAGKFGLPVVTLVDTAGAFPGIDAEARGQAEAIARATEACLALPVPMIAAIVGEGGSGGAVALAAANRILMFENAIYSVISPEGCASILWRADGSTTNQAALAAEAMKVTAQDLLRLGVIDRIVAEPTGGAHRAPEAAASALKAAIGEELAELSKETPAALQAARRRKFLSMGAL
ncbi:acetyl-CoA carboxylase carboxyltransferase subunit alpha [Sphingomonas sp. SUN039]|uniref:acetyl-CoA carboxylase carboxyltransferase subunit alpha n=1 Tax=Sphingomonas sp. SUN039 TaxID=2937787 RepID=UPI002164514C|nr:acetyl-CoA carboxylase carboxyltransferase subunit alpha [Sphingomonas sp. SUN039]UVO53909.1 acetyl-CoA carboxylase carboxyltransferase subunit alpha [Sphingomonas sp. SUN039]